MIALTLCNLRKEVTYKSDMQLLLLMNTRICPGVTYASALSLHSVCQGQYTEERH